MFWVACKDQHESMKKMQGLMYMLDEENVLGGAVNLEVGNKS